MNAKVVLSVLRSMAAPGTDRTRTMLKNNTKNIPTDILKRFYDTKFTGFRRLSVPSSGSLKRRARERQQAESNRLEGERLARERREQRAREKLESQLQARRELETYEPWGRLGGGAPNPDGIRFTNIRAKGIYPEDELRGVQLHPLGGRWTTTPRRRRRVPVRSRVEPQLQYSEQLRKTIDNDIRYRRAPVQQRQHNKMIDDLVEKRYKAIQDQISKSLADERKSNSGPWVKPSSVGLATPPTWRHPREIGSNFNKSMGWTSNETFDKMKEDHRRQKGPSLTLPKVTKDDYYYEQGSHDKEHGMDKLPSISKPNSGRRSGKENKKTVIAKKGMRSPRKNKYVKLPEGEDVTCIVPDDYYDTGPPEEVYETVKKPTPEQAILRLTGGVELVPLLARRRRVGARTLPSSDVTRPPEQPCQWRDNSTAEHLRILKSQMIAKSQRKEESRQNSAESVRRHHATWASLWGRPGHGAPQQRGRYARSNLARLLYVPHPQEIL